MKLWQRFLLMVILKQILYAKNNKECGDSVVSGVQSETESTDTEDARMATTC
jgi:hypothetical protein